MKPNGASQSSFQDKHQQAKEDWEGKCLISTTHKVFYK